MDIVLNLSCHEGASLLWYGQNYLIYPSAFPPGSRTGSVSFVAANNTPLNNDDIYVIIEVSKPDDFGLPYQDLELKTPDGISLRCYLLPQSKSLSPPEATPVPDDTTTDDEVASIFCPYFAWMFIISLVYCKPPNCDYVSWEWW